MKQKPRPEKKTAKAREDRLKAALKANLARRKAQTKARTGPKEGSAPAGEADKG